jgi:peptidoglycan hydrolase CwlO-like protein
LSLLLSTFWGKLRSLVLLVLTTLVSLEAIYLSIFIQLSVNHQARALANVEKDIDEIQEDVEEIAEDVEEIAEDVEDIAEDVEEMQEDIDEIQEDFEEISEDHKEEQ